MKQLLRFVRNVHLFRLPTGFDLERVEVPSATLDDGNYYVPPSLSWKAMFSSNLPTCTSEQRAW